MMIVASLAEREQAIFRELKDFQRATVERCFERFKSGRQRVLVADEVGLGKTLIARGVIAKLARLHQQEGKDLFKALYICSNAAIANQNLRKLKIHEQVVVDGVSDTRLSMQHLKICEQETDPAIRAGYVQLIPLTPATSFSLTSGGGNAQERALIYVVLKHLPEIRKHKWRLRKFLTLNATKGFRRQTDEMRARIRDCNKASNGAYLRDLLTEARATRENLPDELLQSMEEGRYEYISELRLLFAKISVRRLKPDFVIMDEFQRFRALITAKPDSETRMLSDAFLKESGANTLLLSATPFKLYQTLEETAESGVDEHYQEFLEVMDFLFDDESTMAGFREKWSDFSVSIREASSDRGALIEIKSIKQAAEETLYGKVCRTERLLVDPDGSFICDSQTQKPLEISDKDILTFVEAEKLSETEHIPVEYVKSCPYPLSFMEHYQYKTNIKRIKPSFSRRARQVLFVDERKLKKFDLLPANNARLECLTRVAFEDKAERLLWTPPSIPYYPFQGVFKGKEQFSKVLVFSAWDMVPRMIACMLSYECERRTIGKLYAKESDVRNKGYLSNARARYPYRKLTENRIKPLTTASRTLAELYHPVEHMGKSLREIERFLKAPIKQKLDRIRETYDVPESGAIDPDWYWIAPLLFDESADGESARKPALPIPQRKMPADIEKVLVNMTLASPAVCALRVFRKIDLAEKFAAEVALMFDKPEAIAVVELVYGRNDGAHYKNVLKYCVDGNFAAMLDEYAHMLNDPNPESLCAQMCDALKVSTASYAIDTYSSFIGGKVSQIRMRSHFAVGFYQTQGDEKTAQRKENLRTAFNAPFRPFVLATTSIGQEGLDFHNYTRRIMHWNLPHNPVDIEQREGRINRYKCLAIRQSLARKYGGRKFDDDVWKEVFQCALAAKDIDQPELVPYWCVPDISDDDAVKIERIVPMYPYSKDEATYGRLLKILALYRVTLGQARQEELLEYLFNNCDAKDMKDLFINLSPFARQVKDREGDH